MDIFFNLYANVNKNNDFNDYQHLYKHSNVYDYSYYFIYSHVTRRKQNRNYNI